MGIGMCGRAGGSGGQIRKIPVGHRNNFLFYSNSIGYNQDTKHQEQHHLCSSISLCSLNHRSQKNSYMRQKKHMYYLASTLELGPQENSSTASVRSTMNGLFLNGMGIAAAFGFNLLSINITVNTTH